MTKKVNESVVSVVMPVRDAAGTVMEAVASVQMQSLQNWEMIVVDDGSADETPQLLKQVASSDPRVRVVTTPPWGIAAALQAGCEVARSGLIARMDADDWMHPERLAKQVGFLEAHPEIGLVSSQVAYGGEAAGYAAHVDWVNGLTTPREMELRRFVEVPVAHPSVLFRCELLELYGGYRVGNFPEDYELWLRWLEAGVVFAKLPDTLLRWNDPPGRLSRSDARYSVAAFFDMKAAYLARWLRTHVGPERELWLWGAGRITRRRFGCLAEHGVKLSGYIDVDEAKVGRVLDGLIVRLDTDLPVRENSFILAGVGSRGARERIAAHLEARGWVEGADYLLVA